MKRNRNHYARTLCLIATSWFVRFAIFVIILSCVSFSYAQDSLFLNRLYTYTYNQPVQSVYGRGNYLYIGAGMSGLATWDVSDPTSPQVSCSNSSIGSGVTIMADIGGDCAFLSDPPYLRVMDLSNSGNPIPDTSFSNVNADQFVILDTLVYVVDHLSGVLIYSIAHPAHPVRVGNFGFGGYWSIAIDGNRIYIANRTSIQVCDLTNRLSPGFLGIYTTSLTNVRRIAVRNNIIYAANSTAGITVIDATNPAQIHTINTWSPTTHRSTVDLLLVGTQLFVADSSSGVWVLDANGPTILNVIGRYRMGNAMSLGFASNILFVGEGVAGFTIYRYTPISSIPLRIMHPNGGEWLALGAIDTIRWITNGVVSTVSIKANYLYPDGEWVTLALLTPNDGQETWIVNSPIESRHTRIKIVAYNQPDIYDISDYDFNVLPASGLSESSPPDNPNLSAAYPNPFNASTTITFSLPQTESSKLDILDIKGSVVTTLFSGKMSAGEHRMSWLANHNSTGVYFCRLTTESGTRINKLVLVK